MKRQYAVGLVFLLVCVARSEAYVTPRHVVLASMDKNTRELFQEAMDLDAQLYDEGAKLVHRPGYRSSASRIGSYMVRESSWYALGLLLRDAAGDRQRAAEILDAVLKQQYLTPGVKWYGTYRRTPEEPDPTGNPVMWRGYDPNWRHFIGTTLAMVLIEFPDRITPELSKRMYEAIDRAIEGEMKEGRLVPSYSNIALMYGFLWDFAGVHDKRDDWRKQAAVWTESVYALFKKYDAFFEYNSPTYYGVDLYGLALWRDYGSTKRMQTIGSEMEATLWKDIASYYNPRLRNVSGPYDRSYGMDQESYVSIVGVWMRTVLDAKTAPLPAIATSTDHVADVWFAPHLAILGTRIPQDALSQMKQFEGEHLLHKQITEERLATAWIGRDVIFGGESTNKTKDVGTASQFHPATVQWRTPSGEIGWVQLTQAPMIDAAADEHGLKISATGTVRFRIHANDMVQTKVSEKEWELPGLRIAVDSDAKNFSVEKADDAVDVTYSGMTTMRLGIETAQYRPKARSPDLDSPLFTRRRSAACWLALAHKIMSDCSTEGRLFSHRAHRARYIVNFHSKASFKLADEKSAPLSKKNFVCLPLTVKSLMNPTVTPTYRVERAWPRGKQGRESVRSGTGPTMLWRVAMVLAGLSATLP